MKILVIDDVGISTLLVEHFLEAEGHEVLTAKNGQEAIRNLTTKDGIECVIADLFLPDINGFQIYQECQKIGKYHKANIVETPPFILLTSSTRPEHYQQAQMMGFVAALSKPLDMDELKEVLEENDKQVLQTKAAQKPKILVVDAGGDNHQALKQIFAHTDYRLVWATAGSKCLEYLKQKEAFKLVVCDTQLPDMSFASFMSEINELQTETKLPPIILMGHPTHLAKIDKSQTQKLIDVIPYPINHFVLQQRISQILSGAEANIKPAQNTILILDDSTFNATLMKNTLNHYSEIQQRHCKFLIASNNFEALELLKSDYTIFMVIANLNMPQFGIDMIRLYQDFVAQDAYLSSNAFTKPHFVLVTKDLSPESHHQAIQAGFEMILNKSLEKEVLLETLTPLLPPLTMLQKIDTKRHKNISKN